MKIGILAAAYNAEDLEDRLKPFMRDNFIISVVSAPFEGFPIEYKENEPTVDLLTNLLKEKKIQWLYWSANPMTESDARNQALKPLLEEKCDYIWIWDSDEVYTDKQINNILKFIQERGCCWYSIFFKNYVFDEKTWIDGFCPPRIFKNIPEYQDLKLGGFYGDNCVYYLDKKGNKIDYKTLSTNPVFKFKVQPRHLSWLSNETSRKKYEYQMARWGLCSYRWNYQLNKLEFNPEYYKDKPLPELNYD